MKLKTLIITSLALVYVAFVHIWVSGNKKKKEIEDIETELVG